MKTKNSINIFIVDDDPLYLKALEQSIREKLPFITIKTFSTGEECLQQIYRKPHVVILDYFLDSKVPYARNGLMILQHIKKVNSQTKVIMLSVSDSLEVAIKCFDNGSFDYVSKSESSFVKINKLLQNISDDFSVNNKGLKPYQIIGIIAVVILLICNLLWNKYR